MLQIFLILIIFFLFLRYYFFWACGSSLDFLCGYLCCLQNQWVPPTAESATWTSMAQGSTTTQSFLSGHNFLSGSLPSGARYTAALPLSNSADAASTIMTTTASTAAAAVTTLQPSRAPTPSLGKNLLKKIFKHSK